MKLGPPAPGVIFEYRRRKIGVAVSRRPSAGGTLTKLILVSLFAAAALAGRSSAYARRTAARRPSPCKPCANAREKLTQVGLEKD